MTFDLDLAPAQLAKYLQIAANQRKRAANKFMTDYGPESATVAEVNAEIASLDTVINSILKNAAASNKSAQRK